MMNSQYYTKQYKVISLLKQNFNFIVDIDPISIDNNLIMEYKITIDPIILGEYLNLQPKKTYGTYGTLLSFVNHNLIMTPLLIGDIIEHILNIITQNYCAISIYYESKIS